MKILVLQLARFGDIYLTWPVLRALRRKFPGAELDLLVRERFVAATTGLEAVDRVDLWPSKDLFHPLVGGGEGESDQAAIKKVVHLLNQWLREREDREYDLIINLSFSPLSSYVTERLAGPYARVRGYTRTVDGYLSIPDDASAYFYAQVGVGRDNRYHLGEVFAAVADVELTGEDWRPAGPWRCRDQVVRFVGELGLSKPYCVVHAGASQEWKTLPAYKWRQILRKLERDAASFHWVLVGGSEDKILARAIVDGAGLEKTVDLTGVTRLDELFPLISEAEVVLGGDSVSVHIGSLARTRCLNLSFACVNFWETGPRTPGSRVLWAPSPEHLASDRVVNETLALLEERHSGEPIILRDEDVDVTTGDERLVRFSVLGWNEPSFSWDLIRALYTGTDMPAAENSEVATGLQRMRDLADLAVQELMRMRLVGHGKDHRVSAEILDQVDTLMATVSQMVPELAPLVRWFQTEQLRLSVGTLNQLLEESFSLFMRLQWILSLYLGISPAMEAVVQRRDCGDKSLG